jgi:hypothetical protein
MDPDGLPERESFRPASDLPREGQYMNNPGPTARGHNRTKPIISEGGE